MTETLQQEVLEAFRYFHSHPELAFEERLTTARLREVLTRHGVAVHPSGLETGLIAVIEGGLPGPTVGLRADIDALPIQEKTDLCYASVIPGQMHACGHDFHAACILGATLLLHAQRDSLPGRVMVIFQPAEEVDGGGRMVAASPLLHECKCYLAGHTFPGFPAGTVGVKAGPAMAAVDRFKLLIRGRGAHAAHPDQGNDPIVIQAALVQALQTIVSRSMSPFSHSLVSVTRVSAGNTWNVIPETAVLEGTVRTLDPEDRTRVEQRFRQIVAGVAQAFDAQIDVEWLSGSPAVINDAVLNDLAAQVAREQGLQVRTAEDTLGGEDFSQYLMHAPGVFLRIGTGGDYPVHHPQFTVDASALIPAARYFAALTRTFLGHFA